MCEEMRAQIKRLMKQLGVKQSEIVNDLNGKRGYSVTASELSQFLNGLNTPKANRVLVDALGLLVKKRDEVEDLLVQAKSKSASSS